MDMALHGQHVGAAVRIVAYWFKPTGQVGPFYVFPVQVFTKFLPQSKEMQVRLICDPKLSVKC